jgi:hypothetical protein
MTRNFKIFELKKSFIFIKKHNLLSESLHEGRPNFRRSVQPSKENIQYSNLAMATISK